MTNSVGEAKEVFITLCHSDRHQKAKLKGFTAKERASNMTRISKLLVAVTVANSLVAGTASAGYMAHLPPSQYDHPADNMRVWQYSPDKVNDLCKRLVTHADNPYRSSGGETLYACAIGGPAQCILIMPQRSSITAVSYDRLYRHERGHCNGWHH